MSTDLIVGMTPEQVDRYLEILHEKNRLSAEWLQVEKAKHHVKMGDRVGEDDDGPARLSETQREAQPTGDANLKAQPEGVSNRASPEKLGLTAEQKKLLHTEDGGHTYAPIKFLGKQTWIEINAVMKAAGYSWVSKGKDSYWERSP